MDDMESLALARPNCFAPEIAPQRLEDNRRE
jgi:hypothetical protein